jgi:hypothetical protein
VIDGNYLGTDRDFAAVVRAIEAARELGNQRASDSLRETEVVPGLEATVEEIREFARLASASFGHPVGTRKMGVDKLAVVDQNLSNREDKQLTIDTHHHILLDFFWRETNDSHAPPKEAMQSNRGCPTLGPTRAGCRMHAATGP